MNYPLFGKKMAGGILLREKCVGSLYGQHPKPAGTIMPLRQREEVQKVLREMSDERILLVKQQRPDSPLNRLDTTILSSDTGFGTVYTLGLLKKGTRCSCSKRGSGCGAK